MIKDFKLFEVKMNILDPYGEENWDDKYDDIIIEYNGGYPNLCSGDLVVTIKGVRWEFPSYSLSTGGNVWFDDDWSEQVEDGPWSINNWPKGFPEDLKIEVLKKINDEIPHGCCGGCV